MDKSFVFKMSEVWSGNRVDLVKQMQSGNDLENMWIMFDHVKRAKSWTSMILIIAKSCQLQHATLSWKTRQHYMSVEEFEWYYNKARGRECKLFG